MAANGAVRKASVVMISEKVGQQRGTLVDIWRAYKLQIIWMTIFVIFQLFLFGMGVLHYFNDFLPVQGGGTFVAASMMGFGFAMILQVDCTILVFLPAYRWTMGLLRRTSFAHIFPFDSVISFHIILGFTIGCVALAHIISFIVSFAGAAAAYNLSLGDMLYLPGLIGSDHLGITSITGWVMLLCLSIMTLFALPPMRRCNYDAFYWTHKLQLIFWAALILHAPHIWKFILAPLALYFIEKLHKYINTIRWSRVSKIVQVNLLPLDVTHLVIKRPKDFKYNPGDYCFLKIPSNGLFSWHPFTLSSCPEQEDHIWFHVRASGNYTKALRNKFARKYIVDKSQQLEVDMTSNSPTALHPKVPTLQSVGNLNVQVFLDGPYGASTTALFQTKHAVLIGGGIGVTPFASILGSVLAQFRQQRVNCPKCTHSFQTTDKMMRINNKQLKLRKLDFIWVCKEKEQIQWFIDLLHGWEEEQKLLPNDELFMRCQIYLTGKSAKVGEQIMDTNMDGISRGPILGLQSAIKTGRPNWNQVFQNIQQNKKSSVRVFFCGPFPMERELRRLCGRCDFKFSWENFQ